MRLFGKLLIAFTLVVLAALALDTGLRIRREVGQFDADLRRDSEAYGGVVLTTLELAWKEEGEAGAERLIRRVNEVAPHIRLEWIWMNDPGQPLLVDAERAGALGLGAGESASIELPGGAAGQEGELLTFIGGRAPSGRPGALVIHQSLAGRDHFTSAAIKNAIAVAVALLAAVAVLAAVLGHRLVARPVAQLVAKARRVGQGDLARPLRLTQADELGELAAEMNRMCEQLAGEISRRQEATEQLRHADRLMTVGKLASGVAHELGTPLNVVSGRAALIADGEVEAEEARECARVVVEQARRMTSIIRRLLEFARPRPPQLADVELRALAARTLELLAPMARKAGVTLELAPGAAVLAHVDESQVQQVLTNLVVNGVQASTAGRAVRVECALGAASPPPGHPPKRTTWASLAVVDAGAGMDEPTQHRIFEPFFTTKDVGVGTGLGLSVSYGIVREHGGWIDVDSAPGRGSRFTVHLPAADSEPAQPSASSPPASPQLLSRR